MGNSPEVEGPDLEAGVPLTSLVENVPMSGQVKGEPVLLVRLADGVHAVGGACTHYSGPLIDGLMSGDMIRCPWHHACFSVRTGEALSAPALNPLPRYDVVVDNGVVTVGAKVTDPPLQPHGPRRSGTTPFIIIGAGAAGSAAAEMLRREGYDGPVAMIDPDGAAPYDRPNLSKDYLAGTAAEEWIPLREPGFYEEHGIERIEESAASIDAANRTVHLSGGGSRRYEALLIATGSDPIRIPVPGADLPHVHVLRSLSDCRRLIEAIAGQSRVVIAGASFIGLEAAAALRERGLEVAVVAPETTPFLKVLGPELGRALQSLHEEKGVQFSLGRQVSAITEGAVQLSDGSSLPADVVLLGVGVRPRLQLAIDAGIADPSGITVDEFLETAAPGVFAAGDVARYPDPASGDLVRIEHWVHAQRQGQTAARNMLGGRHAHRAVPFFWTRHYDISVCYTGHASEWDAVDIDGDPSAFDCRIAYLRQGRIAAVSTVSRDRDALRAEVAFERGVPWMHQ